MKTITFCWVSDCGGQNLHKNACDKILKQSHIRGDFDQVKILEQSHSSCDVVQVCGQKHSCAMTMTLNHRKDFTGSLVMHFAWKSRKVKKTPIWNFISFWTGLDRTLASKLKAISQVQSCDPVTTCLQNIQPDHTVAIWKRNHLFFAVPVPMVQLWTDLGSQGFIRQRCPWGCFAGSGLLGSVFILI